MCKKVICLGIFRDWLCRDLIEHRQQPLLREHDIEVSSEVLQDSRILIAVAYDHCRIETHERNAVGRHTVKESGGAEGRAVELVKEALYVLGLAVRQVAEDIRPEAEELHELQEMRHNRSVIDAGEGVLDEEYALFALLLRELPEPLGLPDGLNAELSEECRESRIAHCRSIREAYDFPCEEIRDGVERERVHQPRERGGEGHCLLDIAHYHVLERP